MDMLSSASGFLEELFPKLVGGVLGLGMASGAAVLTARSRKLTLHRIRNEVRHLKDSFAQPERFRRFANANEFRQSVAECLDRTMLRRGWIHRWTGTSAEATRLVDDAWARTFERCTAHAQGGEPNLSLPTDRLHLPNVFFDELLSIVEHQLADGSPIDRDDPATTGQLAVSVLRLRDDIYDARTPIEPFVQDVFEAARRKRHNRNHEAALSEAFHDRYGRIEYLSPSHVKILARAAANQTIETSWTIARHFARQNMSVCWPQAFEMIAYPVRDRVLTRFEDLYKPAA